MLISMQEIWPFSDFSLLFGRTYIHWFEKFFQNMELDVKFHAESDHIVRKIYKIYKLLDCYNE